MQASNQASQICICGAAALREELSTMQAPLSTRVLLVQS